MKDKNEIMKELVVKKFGKLYSEASKSERVKMKEYIRFINSVLNK